MARRPTAIEATQLRQFFPALNVGAVWVLGEATPYRPPYTWYNCLAWALGITNRWVWPWGSRNATDAEMTAFLQRQGYARGSNGTLVSYGFSASSVGHVARYYSSSWGWTSKLGQWLLITHGRDALIGGYGARRLFYARAAALVALELKEGEMIVPSGPDVESLSASDRQILEGLVPSVAPRIAKQFEAAWKAWQAELQTDVSVDSSTASFVSHSAYRQLVAMGSAIIPLVMQKMAEPSQWYAVLIADALLPPEEQVTVTDEDPEVLEGEQGRARRTVLQWVDVHQS